MNDATRSGAFNRGLYAINGPLDIVYHSANCTWPEFTILGRYNDYRDVTSLTQVEERDCGVYNLVSIGKQNIIQCWRFMFNLPSGVLLFKVVDRRNATGGRHGCPWQSSVVSTQVNVNISAGE
jgi:hypothetical protein